MNTAKICRYIHLHSYFDPVLLSQNRKIILCSIHRHDSATAREVFNQMSEAARTSPMTRYLMYKIALKDHDEALGPQ